MDDLQLQTVDRAQEEALQNLLQLYTHDFSEHWASTGKGDLNQHGRFPDYPLEPFWTGPDCEAMFLRLNGALAGFALINDLGHSGRRVDANVAEFFVVRKYRRNGVGTRFARTLLATRPGVWEAAVARKNVMAQSFWRKAVNECPIAYEIEELDVVSLDWNGPILRFVVR